MNSASDHPLFAALRDCGRIPADMSARVEQAFVEAGNSPDQLAEQLLAAGCVTKYQHRKIQLGRISDLLFGPYLILERIGEGGMGKVYRAVQIRLNRLVALKTIRPNLLANKTVVSRYKREARAAATLDHPNIVKLYEADDVDGRYYLAMEFVEGMDLSRLTKELVKDKRTILPAEAAEYMRQAALGLQHSHSKGLVHRDIKPSNVLVSGERAIPGTNGMASVKLLDMGLVRSLTEDDNTQMDLTRDGTVVGTPDYMSPEQAKNSSTVDHRADLYSLGCTMFFLLKGSPPFSEGTAIDKLIRHQLDPVPDIRQYRPDVPPGLAAVIKKMMAKKPDDRFQSGDETARELSLYTEEAAKFDFAAAATQSFHYVDLAPPVAEPKSNDSLSTAQQSGPEAAAGTTLAQTGTRTVKPVSQPVSGQRTVRPLTVQSPPPKVQVVRAKVIPKPTGDASPSDSLPGTDAKATGTKGNRSDTPVNPQRVRKTSRRPVRRKQSTFPMIVAGAIAAAVIIALFVIAAIILSRGAQGTPSSKSASIEPAPLALVPVSPYRPVPELLPDDTAAVFIADPKPYWDKAQYDVPAESRERRVSRFLTNVFKFDPWRFERVLVAMQPNPVKCVAVGEGGEPLSKPEQFRKDLDQRPFELETDKNGITLVRVRPGPIKNPFNAERRVRAALLPTPTAYLIGTDATDLADLYKNATTRKGPSGVDPRLLAIFTAPPTSPPPMIFFAASGEFHLPIKAGKTESLRTLGIELLSLRAGLDEKQFQIELSVSGSDASKLRDFLTIELPSVIEAHVGTAGKPLADPVRQSFDAAELTDENGLKKLTARFAWDWQPVHDALEKVLPLPPLPLGKDK